VEKVHFPSHTRFYFSLTNDEEAQFGSVLGPLTEKQCKEISGMLVWAADYGEDTVINKMTREFKELVENLKKF
jgi:hypothetical protein